MEVNHLNMALFFFAFLLPLIPHLYSAAAEPSNSSAKNCPPQPPFIGVPVSPDDVVLLQFALNLEHIEADFFLHSALGRGLDAFAPELVMGGPQPIGATKANLDERTRKIITEFGFEEIGHLRVIKSTVGWFPRPLIDLSKHNFAKIFNQAFGYHLNPPFDPYMSSINYLLAAYLVPYMGLVSYVGANPNLNGFYSKRLLAGLLGVESGQDAVIRTMLYERADDVVPPYENHTVAEFTNRISHLRNQLANCGMKDEGIIVPPELGAERRTSTNILSANQDSLSYRRKPAEVLRVIYGTGDEHKPGGFLPEGGNGVIAREYLKVS